MKIHHIAIIVSSFRSVDFYRKLGFEETKRIDRKNDSVVLMEGCDTQLELFVDPNHPSRESFPEHFGLRHIAFQVDDIDDVAKSLGIDSVQYDWLGKQYFFIYDPDNITIELHE